MLKNCLVAGMLSLMAIMQAGCSTLADAKAAKGSGEVRVYDKSLDEVWEAAVHTIAATDLKIVTEDKTNGSILAQHAMTAFSYGENVAIFIEEADGQVSTRVEIVNKRVLATNITAANWAAKIFKELDAKLGAGKPAQ